MVESKLKVLIVEDDKDVVNLLRFHLANRCEIVGEAGDGATAMRLMGITKPDVAIMAMDLPVLSGLQVAEKCRDLFPSVAIVFHSSHRAPEVVKAAMETGAKDYLFKPTESRELLAVLQRLARDRRSKAEAVEASKAPGHGLWAFASAGGGSGSTSFMLSIANELLATGKRVIVADACAPLGDIGLYLGLDGKPPNSADLALCEAMDDPMELSGFLKEHSSKLKALVATTDPYAASAMDIGRFIEGLLALRQITDYVLVDLPSGIPERLLPVLDEARFVFVSAAPRLAGIKNLRTWIRLLNQLEYPPEKVRPVLLGCDERTRLAECRKAVEAAGAKLLATLPREDDGADAATRACAPISRVAPHGMYASNVRASLLTLLEVPEKAIKPRTGPSIMSRLLGFDSDA